MWRRIRRAEIDTAEHAARVRHELALLYVAVTRARNTLLIYDGPRSSEVWDVETIAGLVTRASEAATLVGLWHARVEPRGVGAAGRLPRRARVSRRRPRVLPQRGTRGQGGAGAGARARRRRPARRGGTAVRAPRGGRPGRGELGESRRPGIGLPPRGSGPATRTARTSTPSEASRRGEAGARPRRDGRRAGTGGARGRGVGEGRRFRAPRGALARAR